MSEAGLRLRPQDVQRAAEVVSLHLAPTPVRRAFCVEGAGAPAWLKLECWQPTGSFKVRGALVAMAALTPAERAAGVVAASAGNHALGVAHAASVLGGTVAVTVFVPESAPRAKVDKLRRFPVEVRVEGRDYDDAFARAQAHAQRTGARCVHAFEDRLIAAGQGTAALELLAQLPDLGTLLVPVGGGGLISGCATIVKARAPHVRVIAVQPQASPALAESLRQGRALLSYDAAPTLADGLAGGIGQIAFDHRDLVDDVVMVSEEEIEDAVAALLREDQVLAEASGAVGVAALRTGKVSAAGRPAAAIVTGANIDVAVLSRLLAARA
ncbi:MAG TPA: threonine/serine dehydratase [Vicinamibacteria bacterium]|nr:threonine/serine dehydratase [Vicinamibacteria bacterium]